MAELLEINELTLSYRTSEGPLPAVRGVDLVVRAGEVVADEHAAQDREPVGQLPHRGR